MSSWLPGGVLTRKLWRDLRGRKSSTLVLIALVGLGVGDLTMLRSLYRDLNSTREAYYRDYRLANFTIDLKRAPERAVEMAAAAPNVADAQGRVTLQVMIELDGRTEPIAGIAHSLPLVRRPVFNDIFLASGTWFSGHDEREVILNSSFAEANHLRPGDRIRVTLLDEQQSLLVVGTATSPEHVFLLPLDGGLAPDPGRFGVMYLPEELLQRSGDLEGGYNQIIGMVYDTSPAALRQSLDYLERELDPWGVTNTTPMHEMASVQLLNTELVSLRSNSIILPSIFLGVAMLILNVMLGRVITQQRSVIGTMRALGRSRGEILAHYLWVGMLVAFLGAVVGMLLSLGLQRLLIGLYSQYYTFPRLEAGFYPAYHLGGFMVALLVGGMGSLRSALRAASLEPAVAMRPAPPEKGGRIAVERFARAWSRLSFRHRLVLRAIFRNPFRSSVNLLTSALAMAILVASFAMADGLNYLVEYQFGKISHQHLSVALREPVADRGAREVADLPTVTSVEPQLSVVCDLRAGHRNKRMGVIGLPSGNRLFTPLDLAGNKIVIPRGGLVLTDKAASLLGVGVGDSVTLRPLVGRRDVTQAPVLGVVKSYLGVSAYADIDYLSRLIGEDRVANSVLGTTDHAGAWERLYEEVKERPDVVSLYDRMRSMQQMKDTFIRNIKVSIVILVLFGGLIAFGSVLNTALVSLSEREREVGTFRVLGYTPAEIASILRGEQVILSGLGIALGAVSGIGLTRLIVMAYDTDFMRMPAVHRPDRLLLAAALMVMFISLAQVLVYSFIRKLPWLDALKVKE